MRAGDSPGMKCHSSKVMANWHGIPIKGPELFSKAQRLEKARQFSFSTSFNKTISYDGID